MESSGALSEALERITKSTVSDVNNAMERLPVAWPGFLALLSGPAENHLDEIKSLAKNLTAQRFGHTVNLYIPIYLSNACINQCAYCGFNSRMDIRRKTLSLDEVGLEGERLFNEGFRNILLVAGESRKDTPLSLMEQSVRALKEMGFVFVGLEAEPLGEDEYRILGEAGLDGVTVYQETYDREMYARVHKAGPKKDYQWRLGAPERVAKAGIRSVSVGFLLGLGEFCAEAVALAAHVKYLQKRFWQTSVSVSFPRIHQAPAGFELANAVSDTRLIKLISAMRLFNPDVTLTLSTREAPALRDELFGVGINQVSAGSKTSPGAYTVIGSESSAGEQFPVVDERPPHEVAEAIKKAGLEFVWKDWDKNLRPVA